MERKREGSGYRGFKLQVAAAPNTLPLYGAGTILKRRSANTVIRQWVGRCAFAGQWHADRDPKDQAIC